MSRTVTKSGNLASPRKKYEDQWKADQRRYLRSGIGQCGFWLCQYVPKLMLNCSHWQAWCLQLARVTRNHSDTNLLVSASHLRWFCVTQKTARYLSNPQNKQQRIQYLNSVLTENGFFYHPSNMWRRLFHYTGDSALCKDRQNSHGRWRHGSCFAFAPYGTAAPRCILHFQNKKKIKVWNIQSVQNRLGPTVCQKILFAHAFGGCNTTNGVFPSEKSVPLKKLAPSEYLGHTCKRFQHT